MTAPPAIAASRSRADGKACEHTTTCYDVLICGGGLAGLTLARQLRLELPSLSVAVIDRLSRPLPEAAHKVGEATTELTGHYLARVLQLQNYLTERQLPKLGLRFFLGNAHGPFEARSELGPRLFSPSPAYLLDRGRFENDLRQIIADMGVRLLEGTIVDDVVLAQGAQAHTVLCHGEDGSSHAVSCRWLIDALGRGRFLQSRLGLAQPNAHFASAAWWRINARIDVSEMATNASREWRHRIIEDRYLSTNHLMGHGYWVWFIPLSSGTTSIGIVTDETIHPFNSYAKSYAQSLEWLREHEPAAWQLIKGRVPLDFRRLKNFSYHARQLFSHQRWTCVGEAGIFLDPLYSPGSDFIAIENTITVEMIRLETEGKLTENGVAEFNRLVLDFLAPIGLAFFKDTYRVFGHPHIYYAKHAWDQAIFSAVFAQLFIQGIIREPSAAVFDLLGKYKELNERVQRLFIDWSERAPARTPFLAHTDLGRSRFHQLLHLELSTRRTQQQFLQAARLNLQYLDEIAQILFWQAVTECLPQHRSQRDVDLPWIDAWKISLSPDRWKADGFHSVSTTTPRSLRALRGGTFAGVFSPMTWRERLQVELPYRLRHFGRGKPSNLLVGAVHRRFVANRPAMWLRRLFVQDTLIAPPRTDHSAFVQQ